VSSPVESFADSTTTWYSPTSNFASIVTPRSPLPVPPPPGPMPARPKPKLPVTSIGGSGAHGSFSQYSTSRGAPIWSTCSNTALGSVFTSSFCSTVGTGITSAKASGAPL
jgi:hypothetical protein